MPMVPRFAIVVVLTALVAPLASAATPRAMYLRAMEREEAVRPALTGPEVPAKALAEARKVVAAYERLVTAHPASGYTDNALWQAAKLAADVWGQTGEEADRVLATGLFKRLIAGVSFELTPVARTPRARTPPAAPCAGAAERPA